MNNPTINPERFLSDLHELRTFGQYKTGVIRPAYSDADMQARYWLKDKMFHAGLNATIDGLGNVIGYSGKSQPTLLMGSHSDTQPEGGWLDGAYGVICALEVSRALAECQDTAHLSVDVASWADEEHTFHGFLGSKGFLNQLDSQVIHSARSADGYPLSKALSEAGLNGIAEQYDPTRYIGYLEPHIEQGPRLELAGRQVGIVTGIVGCRDFDITFTGEANHAGSTPMELRQDAGSALLEFAWLLNQRFKELAGQYTVWTIGRVEFFPGAACVIPARATMHLQFRDTSEPQLDLFEESLRQLADSMSVRLKSNITVTPHGKTVSVNMDSHMQEILCQIAQTLFPDRWQTMPSAAMHDANMFGSVMPSGMVFVPSIGGISHNIEENTKEEDLIAGCQLAAAAAAEILHQFDV